MGRRVASLLASANPQGHKHAIGAMLVATTLVAPAPVTVLTFDPDDLSALGEHRITVIKV